MNTIVEFVGKRRRVRVGSIEPAAVDLLRRFDPVIVVACFLGCELIFGQPLSARAGYLALFAFVLSSPLLGRFDVPDVDPIERTPLSRFAMICSRVLVRWGMIVAVLLFTGFAFKVSALFSRKVLLAWFAITPAALAIAQAVRVKLGSAESARQHRYIIVGVNDVGLELAKRLSKRGFCGYFDFRSPDRLGPLLDADKFAGHCRDLANHVRSNAVDVVYIALPLSNVPRMSELINALRDTTASVYFVPNAFAFDLIQGRLSEINGMPVLSVCDTPFQGTDAIIKRSMDITIGGLAFLISLPVMTILAAAVKLSSPGPVLFRQRRYGLNGAEITVYKFRSMTVCDDGPIVHQATRQDARVTKIGRFIRRTSLDELPQLINVLQGTMSLVGPRPHAIAHNEKYRRLINGYMVRHKVRPGITGLAQVNGLRGETETLDKMSERVRFDLEYLRNWSPWLDISILARSLAVIWSDYRKTY